MPGLTATGTQLKADRLVCESTWWVINYWLHITSGSFECRVGWMSDQEPRLMFRNAVAKSRGKKDGEMEILVGNDIGNIELVRWSLKSQFDRDVITHYDAQV